MRLLGWRRSFEEAPYISSGFICIWYLAARGKTFGRYFVSRHRRNRKTRVCRKRPAGVAAPSALAIHEPAMPRVSW